MQNSGSQSFKIILHCDPQFSSNLFACLHGYSLAATFLNHPGEIVQRKLYMIYTLALTIICPPPHQNVKIFATNRCRLFNVTYSSRSPSEPLHGPFGELGLQFENLQKVSYSLEGIRMVQPACRIHSRFGGPQSTSIFRNDICFLPM